MAFYANYSSAYPLSDISFLALMRRSPYLTGIGFVLTFLVISCVDPLDLSLRGTVDVVVVDGTITNLAEPQVIWLNRSRADPLTGRFGTLPIAKATVEVVVDSAQVIACHETIDGSYQLPSDFRGQVGHAYQLRFTLSDGARYVSNQQVMQAVPPIGKLTGQFNPKSLPTFQYGGFTAGYDFLIDTQDPANQRNYYRWDWDLYEQIYWCRTCTKSVYAVFEVEPYPVDGVYRSGTTPFENCFAPGPPISVPADLRLDYRCRTQCWEIIHSRYLNLHDDQLTNGGLISGRNIGQIPLYTRQPALVVIRQSSLTPDAHQFFKLLENQTQNTGGLADLPPTVPIGNVHNTANSRENVVGYFTASAVATSRYWLDKQDSVGSSKGAYDENGVAASRNDELFYALNGRFPVAEDNPPPSIVIVGGPPRPPTAICVFSDSRTPFKPEGWRD